VESGSVTRSDQPTLELSAGGGYVARFKKQP
jgi:hypothetical protein